MNADFADGRAECNECRNKAQNAKHHKDKEANELSADSKTCKLCDTEKKLKECEPGRNTCRACEMQQGSRSAMMPRRNTACQGFE